MKSQALKQDYLPDKPGVYLFKRNGQVLYIGKATSLKDRVRSYFSRDIINTRGPLILDMVFQADKVDYIITNSVLEALILEANLIKKHQPRFNTKEKDDKSFNYVVITKEDFPKILIERGKNLFQGEHNIKNTFGPFTNGGQLKEALKIVRKIFPFRDRCVPLSGKPCFNKQIGLCPGVCNGTISKNDYRKIIKKIELLFLGKIQNLKTNLVKEMNDYSKNQDYEKANEIKSQIFALDHIHDVSLIKGDVKEEAVDSLRIEAYDAAHLSGTNNVGVMVVMKNGEFIKNEYRKFKIVNTKGNDAGALREMLERRLKHTEWTSPNIIVVDGGIIQYNIAKSVANRITIVAVTKDHKHKAKGIIGDEIIVKKYKKQIIKINNESHRFAIAFHRQRRNAII